MFCDYFVTALTSRKNRKSKFTVPLVTDSLGTVCIALKYLYDRFLLAVIEILQSYADSSQCVIHQKHSQVGLLILAGGQGCQKDLKKH